MIKPQAPSSRNPFDASPLQRIRRFLRFLSSLVPAFLGLFGVIAVASIVAERISGFMGALVGLCASACLGLGVLLAYWNAVDWRNISIIRNQRHQGEAGLKDGEISHFEGVVRIDGAPLISPFSEIPCAAYSYEVTTTAATHRRSRKRVICQGFHMAKTRIDGRVYSLGLMSFPSFEDELVNHFSGRKMAAPTQHLVDEVLGEDPASGERERSSALLEARADIIDEIHRDYRFGAFGGTGDNLVVVEEVLPLDQRISVIGTYDANRNAMTAQRSRFGPNLMIYKGAGEAVLERVGKDVGRYAKIAAALLIVGGAIFGVSLLYPFDAA